MNPYFIEALISMLRDECIVVEGPLVPESSREFQIGRIPGATFVAYSVHMIDLSLGLLTRRERQKQRENKTELYATIFEVYCWTIV